MPIITVQFIKDVVATPDQKREVIVRLTDTFCDILGDVVRPFVYCLIQETPQQEWGIAGVPMPDLVYLTSDKHAQVIGRSNDLMRGAIAQMTVAQVEQSRAAAERADAVWRGAANSISGSNGAAPTVDRRTAAERADAVWRGAAYSLVSSNGAYSNGSAASADAVWRGADARSNSPAGGHAEAHRRLFARWFEELWNKKNYDIAYELVHPDFTAHGAGGQDIKQGPDGVIGMVKAWHAAMPDGRMTMDDIITEGDLSTIRMTWEETHTGKFGDIPASGKRIKVTSIGIDRVVDGKITEGWGELNMLGMLQQMGAIPQS
jgi:4-oxalocrotonate tautomerase family enzyme